MFPAADTGKPSMIDFQFWGPGIGTDDLAHLTRIGFSDDFRREIQLNLVKHYHETLIANGIRNYPFDMCLKNYRMSVASMVLIPMWQYTGFGVEYGKWIGDVKGLVYNFECMKCGEL